MISESFNQMKRNFENWRADHDPSTTCRRCKHTYHRHSMFPTIPIGTSFASLFTGGTNKDNNDDDNDYGFNLECTYCNVYGCMCEGFE
jgi:hypothetical protein